MKSDIFGRFVSFVRKEKLCFTALAFFLVALPVVSFLSYPIPHALLAAYFGKLDEKVTQGVVADEQYVFGQVGAIADSPDLTRLIQAGDVPGLTAVLESEQATRGLTALSATDANGVVFARTQATSRRGDYVFQTTVYGQKVCAGGTTVSVERGTALPLLVIAGFPVDASGTMVGAVFGGYSIDDTYAHAFRERYLSGNTNLIFYSRTDGVVGTTFDDPGTKALLAAYFSTGSDWVARGQSDQNVVIEGRSYFVENVALPGCEGSAGGVLVLYPDHHILAAMAFAFFATLVFFLIIFYFHTRWSGKKRRTVEYCVLLVLSFVIFATTFAESAFILYRQSIVVEKPPYLIYNSTLSLDPDYGIFDRSVEQRIAVKVSTGGEAINAAQINLAYDPAKLRVVDIATDDSFCSPSMFLQKEIDNQKGEVQVACATPTPGLSGDGIVIDLDVQALQEGEATLDFASGTAILANDGLGTDVLRLATNASYHFVDERHPVVKNGIASVLAFSPTHPNSARWYNDPNVLMTWSPADGEQFLYAIDQTSTVTTLAGASTTDVNSIMLNDLSGGVWYFHIAAEKNGLIGPISDYKVMIDTTPPATPVIQASETTVPAGQIVRLAFESSAGPSGLLNNYYVKFDSGVFLPTASPLFIALPEGSHTVTIRAFDEAGNFTDGSIMINVTKAQSQ